MRPAYCYGSNRTLITTWVGEPWHPTQLEDHSRQDKARAKDGLAKYRQMATTGHKRTPEPLPGHQTPEEWAKLTTTAESGKTRCSVAITNKLCSIQRKIPKSITSGLSTMAGDVMDMHTYILPMDLLFSKLLFHAALHLCSLPTAHPLPRCVHSKPRVQPSLWLGHSPLKGGSTSPHLTY